MVSKKKKGQGKAKKVAKKAEEKQEAAANEQQGTPDGQMQQRLKIDEDSSQDEDALLEEAIKLAAAEKEAMEAAAAEQEETSQKLAEKHGNGCSHGYATTKENHLIIEDFANTFISGFVSVGGHILNCAEAAEKATREKYPEVWRDSSKLKQVVSLFIANGTQKVLKGNIDDARTFAFLSCHLQNYIAVWFHKTKPTLDLAKKFELWKADEHTLVKYLKKNIPCNCLDEKYKKVKSITKMGFCCNPECEVPDRMVERKTMLYCTRCRGANYCSPECQKADWPCHKEICDVIVD